MAFGEFRIGGVFLHGNDTMRVIKKKYIDGSYLILQIRRYGDNVTECMCKVSGDECFEPLEFIGMMEGSKAVRR